MADVMAAWEDFSGTPGEWQHNWGVLRWRRTYPGRVDQATQARKLPALLLADTGRGEEAEWIAAELISNAILHSRSADRGGWFGVEVFLAEFAQIAVYDLGGRGVPLVSNGPADGELPGRERGLLKVRSVASKLCVTGDPASGHLVWAQLELEAGPMRFPQ